MRVQAVEALARWQHPERGLVSPAEFIPFAEESGLIISLGRHLLAQALRSARRLAEDAWPHHPVWRINISAREVQRSDICGEVKRAAAKAGLAPSALEIEFTETAVLADPGRAAEVAACLREAGATVALDDFGTGYSSLTHLRELPIDRVKIDRSFVGSCLEDRSAAAILVAVTRLAHDLGMEVVAEGVETQAQLEFVKAGRLRRRSGLLSGAADAACRLHRVSAAGCAGRNAVDQHPRRASPLLARAVSPDAVRPEGSRHHRLEAKRARRKLSY